jgi:hypothetical protein
VFAVSSRCFFYLPTYSSDIAGRVPSEYFHLIRVLSYIFEAIYLPSLSFSWSPRTFMFQSPSILDTSFKPPSAICDLALKESAHAFSINSAQPSYCIHLTSNLKTFVFGPHAITLFLPSRTKMTGLWSECRCSPFITSYPGKRSLHSIFATALSSLSRM